MRAFYDTFYWPNNATVTVVGDFEPAAALALIRKYYGAIPPSPRPIPQVYTTEPPQLGPRRLTIKRAGELGVVEVAYKTPPSLDPDSPALQVLTSILVDDKSSRFYRGLTDKGLVTGVASDDAYFRDGALDILEADLAPGATPAQVERAMLAEIENVKEKGVSDEEVAAAVSQIVADTAFQRDGPTAITARLQDAIALGDWTAYFTRPRQIAAVTAADVQRVARRYLVEDQSTTGWYVPIRAGEGGAVAGPAAPAPVAAGSGEEAGPALPMLPDDAWTQPLAESSPHGNSPIGARVVRRTVAGIDVLSLRTSAQDFVFLAGSLPAGREAYPSDNVAVPDLVGRMLDQGTRAHDKSELAQKLARAGASLIFLVDGGAVTFSGRCLSRDVSLVLGILAEELRQPEFPAEQFAKVRTIYAGNLLRLKADTEAEADRAFSECIFPDGHPSCAPTLDRLIADVNRTSPADLKAFHAAHYGPAAMHLILVGDVDDSVVDPAVLLGFGGWTGGSPLPPVPPDQGRRTGGSRVVFIPDKPSVNVVIGQADPLRYSDPDHVALGVGTAILGSGFSGRLMSVVRNENGLTYGIAAGLEADTFSPGCFRIAATFSPSLLERGLRVTRGVLREWYDHGVTAEDLAYRKTNCIGSFQVGLSTARGAAGTLLAVVQAGLPPSFLDDYPRRVEALTRDQVNRAIRRYLNPDEMVTVLAGTVP